MWILSLIINYLLWTQTSFFLLLLGKNSRHKWIDSTPAHKAIAQSCYSFHLVYYHILASKCFPGEWGFLTASQCWPLWITPRVAWSSMKSVKKGLVIVCCILQWGINCILGLPINALQSIVIHFNQQTAWIFRAHLTLNVPCSLKHWIFWIKHSPVLFLGCCFIALTDRQQS